MLSFSLTLWQSVKLPLDKSQMDSGQNLVFTTDWKITGQGVHAGIMLR